MEQSRNTDSGRPAPSSPHVIRGTVLAGLCIAIIGSTALAAIEWALATWFTVRRLGGEPLPVNLVLATFGKFSVSHLLLWLPVMAVSSLIVAGFARRASRVPEPLIAASFAIMAGLVVVPPDLAMRGWKGPSVFVGIVVGVAIAATIVYGMVTLVRYWFGPTGFVRLRYGLTSVCAPLLIGGGVLFFRSPLANVDRFQIRPGKTIQSSSEGPNVLWIVMDTVRADRTTVYGYTADTTPFLNEWAKQAIVFDNAVADGIWTLPAHVSMFTGLSGRQHGARCNHAYLDKRHTTVAQVLTEEGYATASFSCNELISRRTGVARGFQECRVVAHLRNLSHFSLEALCEQWGITPVLPWFDGDFGAAVAQDLIANWLDRRANGEPFFLFVNYMEAHLPYRVPKRYRRMFMDEEQVHRSYDLRRSVFGDVMTAMDIRYNIDGPDFVTMADREVLKRQYLAGIRYVDDRVREMVRAFEQRGLLDNTLVIITADHGEYLDTHGLWSHCFHTYNDVTHIPMLIREPGRTEGLRFATPVQPSDLYPTVVSATRGRPEHWPGYGTRDLLKLVADGETERTVICQCFESGLVQIEQIKKKNNPALMRRAQPEIAGVDGRFKYIRPEDAEPELYDIVADAGEQHNLIDSNADQAKRLANYIRQWESRVMPFKPDPSRVAENTPVDVREALRALGYLSAE